MKSTFVGALLLVVTSSISAATWPTATVGPQSIWDQAADKSSGTRFIPMQLVVPAMWDGSRRIDMPIASGTDAEGTQWSGPGAWRNPYSNENIVAYDRHRSNRREGVVDQKMMPRADGSAVGRVYDSRFGGIVCDGEGKYPLGVWRQGESRTFDYTCRTTRDGATVEVKRRSLIVIEELDYEYSGTPHSLRFEWKFSDAVSGEVLDHRTYIFSPGIGLAAEMRR
ncbi:MAG: hypothetical protein JWL63_1685 [Rhodocyclales bacterium]|nr:hypothetical protein [Rhodocyclales bacterium]